MKSLINKGFRPQSVALFGFMSSLFKVKAVLLFCGLFIYKAIEKGPVVYKNSQVLLVSSPLSPFAFRSSSYLLKRFRIHPAVPAIPVANRKIDAGSGTDSASKLEITGG